MREIAGSTPAQIRARVREIITNSCSDHLVVEAKRTPEAIDAKAEANYHALIDAVQEFGAR